MSRGILLVAERAKREPTTRFLSLAHLVDADLLRSVFQGIRKDAVVGVDGVTKEQYGQALEENLRNLHERLKAGRYRHQPILRGHVPKAQGKTRPIGISSIEDKIVQGALTRVLEAVYEPVFEGASYGFRVGRSAHQAMRVVDQMLMRENVKWVLEADIQAFFDSINRPMLEEMLQEKIADGRFLRLIGKCLHVGVLEGEEFTSPDVGTAQGSIISPMLGNIYLHHVLDMWMEQEVKPMLAGGARLVRYADDFVIGFAHKEDAERVMDLLQERMAKYGLKLHPDKTRLIPMGKPDREQDAGKGVGSFDFLGFTVFWRRTRGGRWTPGMKTRKARLRRALVTLNEWCRRHRHDPPAQQHAALSRRLVGHYNYFGVNGNLGCLEQLRSRVERIWHAWLNRRSQRRSLSWEKFARILEAHPLPRPTIRVQIWGRT